MAETCPEKAAAMTSFLQTICVKVSGQQTYFIVLTVMIFIVFLGVDLFLFR